MLTGPNEDPAVPQPLEWFEPPAVTRLSGDEPITGTESRVRDFWSWAYSDLRANTVRPLLAEFLVASALGAHQGSRIEWDAYDVSIPGGGRVEVKSAAYLQAWRQPSLSKIQFGGLRSRTWSDGEGMSTDISYHADVYVFAVLDGKTHDEYDALNTSRWLFWVISASEIRATGQNSMNLGTVKRLGAIEVSYPALEAAILQAWEHEKTASPTLP